MKPDIHPEYRPVVFQDQAVDFSFLTKSTIQTDETVEWEDGNTYPLAKVEISAASHPFFTGTMRIVDTAGRVERFERRFGRRRGAPEGGAAEGDAPEGAVEEAAPEAPVAEEAPVVEEAAAEEVVADEAPAEEVVADEAAAEDVSDGETPADDAEATED